MTDGIFNVEVEGRTALGFDTGLNPAAFAQAKMNQLLGTKGYIVNNDGTLEEWQLEGVIEYNGSMVLWGPGFEGSIMMQLLETGSDTALNALRRWSYARQFIDNDKIGLNPGPLQTIIAPDGKVLFLPENLVHRVLIVKSQERYREGIEVWKHPDLNGDKGLAFTYAAFSYKVFTGKVPFSAATDSVSAEVASDSLRINIREAVFLPTALAAPGIDNKLASLIDQALKADPKHQPGFQELEDAVGIQGKRNWQSFFHVLSTEEQQGIDKAKERFLKRQKRTISTKRYVRRNLTLIGIAAVVLFGGILVWRGIVSGQARRPSTAGMDPLTVANEYYLAMNRLDHEFMDAAVVDKAGEQDIRAVMNFFVISKMREAYEHKRTVISPPEWLERGGIAVEENVFGVSDLELEVMDTSENRYRIQADYIFWFPSERDFDDQQSAESSYEILPQLPSSLRRTDTLGIELRNDLWRISSIQRIETEVETE